MNLIALLGGGKGKPAPSKKGAGDPASDEPDADDDETSERMYARAAFDALKDDDEAGFVDAFTSAVKACVKRVNGGAYDGDSDDETTEK